MEAAEACAIVRSGDTWIAARRPARVVTGCGHDAFAALDEIAQRGFWVGYLAYDLGRSIERIAPRVEDDLGLPHLAFARFDEPFALADLDALTGSARRPRLGRGTSSLTRGEHARRVRAVHELLRAGDCYQVNLTRRLTFDSAPDPVGLFAAVAGAAPAPHAGMCSFGSALDGLSVVSASPELFLHIDGHRVETRPIKGTHADPAVLRASSKDRAENVMIVDLARNDLGRVCDYGSVRAPGLFDVEAQPGLHHLVSTVRGRLREGTTLADVVRATFPPASVTGAPKPRVLQAIEDLEPVRRGVYCGAFGWIDADRRRAELAVSIRTFTIAGGRTYFGVGGGIVADSRAELEWAETELKAAHLLHAAGAFEDRPVGAR